MLMIGGFGTLFAGTLIVNLLVPEHLIPTVLAALALVVGAVCCVGTATGLLVARRRGLIGINTVWLATGTWLSLSCVVARLLLDDPFTKVHQIVFMFGMLSLPLSPLAAAPLAVAWNRHR